MKITGRLFLSPRFKMTPSRLIETRLSSHTGFNVRLFCKPDGIDENIFIRLENPGSFSDAELFFHTELENYRVLNAVSGKKVFLQVKDGIINPSTLSEPETVLDIPFGAAFGSVETRGALVLTENNLRSISAILGFVPGDILTAERLKAMDRLVYQRLSNPPDGFDEIILSLSDKNLQRLLNSLLHKNIASADMLAAYIHGLGERGQVLMDNLSRGVRQEVGEKVRAARISATYRWADEVNYIINRNILIAIREMDLDISGLEISDYLRRGYETAIALEQLSSKGLEDWLEDFAGRDRLRDIINGVGRQTMASALTFSDRVKTLALFGQIISKDGVRLLGEDIAAAEKLPEDKRSLSLVHFLRVIKKMYFSPIVEKLDFEQETVHAITESGAVDLISDEIGFAKTVYALKNMPREWLNRVLTGVLKNIYEDVLADRIAVKNFADYRNPECRRDFLNALYVLGDEEKI